ncbi:MAG: hypothetical protein ABSA97_07200 [Verrucomicrobiia bacterium]
MSSITSAITRAGIVEIGSRAIRLLVAEISPAGRLAIVTSNWRETGLAMAQSVGGIALDKKVDEVSEVVNAFLEEGRTHQPNRMCIFATEAVRRMSNEHVATLRERIPGLEIIDRKTEACCSLLGAITPFETPTPTDESFVIDQGAGSMELAVGRILISGVELSAYKSYRLGTQELIEDLNESQKDFENFSLKLHNKVKKLKLVEVAPNLCPIVLGSAATKMAWIRVRRNPTDRYEPGKVHDQIIDLQSIDKLAKLAVGDSETVRRIIDPLNPKSLEFETVMTGLIAISVFLKQLGKSEFRVSAYGPRFGVVWMTAVYQKLGFDLPRN